MVLEHVECCMSFCLVDHKRLRREASSNTVGSSKKDTGDWLSYIFLPLELFHCFLCYVIDQNKEVPMKWKELMHTFQHYLFIYFNK